MKTNPSQKWKVFSVVALGVFMSTVDTTIVNVSLPNIAAAFHVPLNGGVEWIVISYLVMIVSLLLSVGRLADITGRKRIWLIGLLVFTIGSALCGLARSLEFLVGARAIQGVGASVLMALGPGLITRAFGQEERGKALGLLAVVSALSMTAGPTLGGILISHLGWWWIFYVNVPIGAVAMVMSSRFLVREVETAKRRFDPFGASLLGLGLMAFTGALSFGHNFGWQSPPILCGFAVSAASIAAMVWFERHEKEPVLDFSLWKNRTFASASVTLVASWIGGMAISIMMPFYLLQLRSYSPEQTGLMMTPLPLAYALFSPAAGWLSDRVGTRWLTAAGLSLLTLGLMLLSGLEAGASRAHILAPLLIAGVGQGAFQPSNNSALMGSVGAERQGLAGGLLATGRTLGQSLATAMAGSIFEALGGASAGRQLVALPSSRSLLIESKFEAGFQTALLCCALFPLIGVVVALMRAPASGVNKSPEARTSSLQGTQT